MNIGFDAKRAFHNNTGLGHYSRTLINSLSQYFPMHNYFLFNPNPSSFFKPNANNLKTIEPQSFLHKKLSSVWRSSWVKKDLQKLHINLYHGLSHEIPIGIQNTNIKSVVTIHDLIHERYPEQYNKIDVKIYHKKFKNACVNANHIIAISKQTKDDIINFYEIETKKITVCYQSCNPIFAKKITTDEKKRVRQYYGLPEKYFLYVGSIIERKNLLTICKAIHLLKDKVNIPLVVIGDGSVYKEKVKEYISLHNLSEKIIFLSETKNAQKTTSFKNATDFPAIYQSAIAMIYPSIFEGFGIPVLEALWSKLPVITSNVSCLPEAAGENAILINPLDVDEMATAMLLVSTDEIKRMEMIDVGWQHANLFTNEKCASSVMDVYNKVVPTIS
jgi:glycosyltransferase involved in cell wall biosynthesis